MDYGEFAGRREGEFPCLTFRSRIPASPTGTPDLADRVAPA
jgi:hypothetical protein